MYLISTKLLIVFLIQNIKKYVIYIYVLPSTRKNFIHYLFSFIHQMFKLTACSMPGSVLDTFLIMNETDKMPCFYKVYIPIEKLRQWMR